MEYYNDISKGYNELHGEEQLIKLKFLIQRINLKGSVLDVGAGTCLASKFFKDYFAVEPANKLLEQSSIKNKYCCTVEDMHNHLPKKEFDNIISITAAHHFKNLDKAFKNIKFFLKKEGLLVISLLKTSQKISVIDETAKKYFNKEEEFSTSKEIFLVYTNTKFI